jgi:excisionase family DNA binding protein
MAKKEKQPVSEVVWLTLEQTAEVLGESWQTVRRWARDGDVRVPAYRVWDESDGDRGRFRFKKSDVEAFKTHREIEGESPSSATADGVTAAAVSSSVRRRR